MSGWGKSVLVGRGEIVSQVERIIFVRVVMLMTVCSDICMARPHIQDSNVCLVLLMTGR